MIRRLVVVTTSRTFEVSAETEDDLRRGLEFMTVEDRFPVTANTQGGPGTFRAKAVSEPRSIALEVRS